MRPYDIHYTADELRKTREKQLQKRHEQKRKEFADSWLRMVYNGGVFTDKDGNIDHDCGLGKGIGIMHDMGQPDGNRQGAP